MNQIMGRLNIKEVNGIEYLYTTIQTPTETHESYCGSLSERSSLENAFGKLGKQLLGMVFISHSINDKEQIKNLRNSLIANGIFAYIAESSPTLGQELPKKIISSIKASQVFVLVLTSNSIKSQWVLLELWTWYQEKLSRNGDYPIVIIREGDLKEEDIPASIRSLITNREYYTIKNDQTQITITTNAVQKIFEYLDAKQKAQTAAIFLLGALLILALSKR